MMRTAVVPPLRAPGRTYPLVLIKVRLCDVAGVFFLSRTLYIGTVNRCRSLLRMARGGKRPLAEVEN